MTDHLHDTLHNETMAPNALLVQTVTSNADGTANDIRTNYDESDNESEKPILLELGASSNVTATTTELSSVPYASDYPLDIHLNNVYGISVPTHSHTYHTDSSLLYNNSYNDGTTATTHQTLPHPSHQCNASTSLISLNTVPYTVHIPQTVYTWSTPTPLTSITPTELNTKLTTEIVPPPVYMSYPDAREHTISKEANPSWKVKALQSEKDYKKTACDRERTRMRDMNKAFDLLRSKLPISKPNGKKYSKIESLRIAINYINHLQKTLKDSTSDANHQTPVEYLTELNVRRRSHAYRFENHNKCNSFDDNNDKLENLDESRSTWSDGYIPNSEDKWE
ncbi:helix-loop-helix protein 6 [Calliphora vicina]|uniref:helix-loop-helix protein 6 n=1 Tax=Calliphora vicina TaxID=7373 RepID=UPI00325AF301